MSNGISQLRVTSPLTGLTAAQCRSGGSIVGAANTVIATVTTDLPAAGQLSSCMLKTKVYVFEAVAQTSLYEI